MCSGSEAGSYLRLIDFGYHSTLGLRVIKKKKAWEGSHSEPSSMKCGGTGQHKCGVQGYLDHKKHPPRRTLE